MRYKMIRVPLDVWEDWFKRKERIQQRIKFKTNRSKNVSLTNVLRFYGKRRTYLFDDEVLNFFKNKKTKNMGGEII